MEALLLGLAFLMGMANQPAAAPTPPAEVGIYGSLEPCELSVLSPDGVAIYNHIRKRNPKMPEEYAASIAQAIDLQSRLAAKAPVDCHLVAAVLSRESSFRPDAVSTAGALGIAQMLPGTAADYGVDNPLDPLQGIQGCVRYLYRSLTFFKDHEQKERMAVASYWRGVGGVSRTWPDGKFPEDVEAFVKYILDLRKALATEAEEIRESG